MNCYKIPHFLSCGAVILLLGVSEGYAQSGRPFQELQEQIDANAAAIASNAQDFSELENQIELLAFDLSSLRSDVAALEARVSINADDISAALARILVNEANIQTVKVELEQLRAQQERDVASILDELADIRRQLEIQNSLREQLASRLAAEIENLNDRINSNTFAIDSLILDIVSINARLSTVNSDILSIQMTLGSLTDALAETEEAIAAIEERLALLEAGGNQSSARLPTNVLDTFSLQVRTNNRQSNIIDLSDYSSNNLAVRYSGDCFVLGNNSVAVTFVNVLDEDGEILVSFTGCSVGGVSNGESASNLHDDAFFLPEGASSIEIGGRLAGSRNFDSGAFITLNILGN